MKESEMMVRSLIRGSIIAILTMNLVENFEISTLGWSMVLYAVAMKSSNVILNQLREFDNA